MEQIHKDGQPHWKDTSQNITIKFDGSPFHWTWVDNEGKQLPLAKHWAHYIKAETHSQYLTYRSEILNKNLI